MFVKLNNYVDLCILTCDPKSNMGCNEESLTCHLQQLTQNDNKKNEKIKLLKKLLNFVSWSTATGQISPMLDFIYLQIGFLKRNMLVNINGYGVFLCWASSAEVIFRLKFPFDLIDGTIHSLLLAKLLKHKVYA